MSDTPETDKEVRRAMDECQADPRLVKASFARTLETQRDEAKAEAKREGDRARQEQDRSHQAEWKAFQANLALVEARAEVERLRKALEGGDQKGSNQTQPVDNQQKEAVINSPEIFEAHGREWYRHTPGDKMPCESGVEISILLKCGYVLKGNSKAFGYWGTSCPSAAYIIGWRPVDAPEKLPR